MLLLMLLACPPSSSDSDSGPTACTTIAAASTNISVVDPTGAPLTEGVTVQWSTDNTNWQDAECMGDCSTWVAGWEVSGTIYLAATYEMDTSDPCCWYNDYETTTVDVPMDEAGCHVVGQMVTITLETDQMVCADSTECG